MLEVTDLAVRFGGEVDALRGVTFSLERGETLAIVGETGSGKSTLAMCLAGLIQPPEARGSVRLEGAELIGPTEEELRAVRWEKVALALQSSPFNPVTTVGDQVAEPRRDRRGLGAREARRRAASWQKSSCSTRRCSTAIRTSSPGGERLRAALAMVLCLEPSLVAHRGLLRGRRRARG